jgi:hypothetical protein
MGKIMKYTTIFLMPAAASFEWHRRSLEMLECVQ